MRGKRVMSHLGHVVWYCDGAFMVARGDGMDEYFSDLESAMAWIESLNV